MFQDVRYAMRILMQNKGWTLMVVLSLALGIGANATLFSGINGMVLRKLPVENPDALVRLRWVGDNDAVTDSSDYGFSETENGIRSRATLSYPMYQEFRKANQTMLDLIACAPDGGVNLAADGRAEIAKAFISSGNYYEVLGVKPAAGRLITAADDRLGAPPVAVISYRYWTQRFGNDPAVVGKLVRVNNAPVTIVGVIDPEFSGIQTLLGDPPDISFPLALDPVLNGPSSSVPKPRAGAAPPGGIRVDDPSKLISLAENRLNNPMSWWLQVVGRLKPGVTREQVAGNLDGVFQSAARDQLQAYLKSLTPEARSSTRNRDRRKVPVLRAASASRGIYNVNAAEIRGATILSVVVALVLLIICANVANLLLSRAAARQKEISVRLSLGATRGRLVRQLLTESILLALIGGACGLLVASWARQLLPGAAGRGPLDWHFFLFLFTLALITGLIFGIAPALRATSRTVSSTLKENSRTIAGSRSRLSKLLLVTQIAVSVVLLIGAGLFLRTLRNLQQVDVGFDPLNLVLFSINPALNHYDQTRVAALYLRLSEQLKGIPGVRDVTLSDGALLSGRVRSTNIAVQDKTAHLDDDRSNIYHLEVAPNFFEVMKMPLLAGRGITASDVQDAPSVAVINEAAARKFFPGEDPIGHRFGESPEQSGKIEIVGIVRDAKYNSLREDAPPTMYVPFSQSPLVAANFAVRAAIDPAGLTKPIREAIQRMDPDLPVPDIATQMERIGGRLEQERLFAQAYSLFGTLAVLVASIGLFGLMSYNVARRTNEIGIRMALGAQRSDVVGMVVTESMVLVLIGLAAGLGIALAAGRFVRVLLYGLNSTDPVTIVSASLLMAAVAALAGYLPARRAARVDPTVALRYE